MRVLDMEFEIPIPAKSDGNPDWSICQRAWWDAVVTVYEWSIQEGRRSHALATRNACDGWIEHDAFRAISSG